MKERSLDSVDRQRQEARKRLLAARRATSFRHSSATEGADSIEIYIPGPRPGCDRPGPRPARARARGFFCRTVHPASGHCERGPPRAPAPAGTARPGPSCPSRARGFFTFLTPREGARAGLGAVPLRPVPPPGPLLLEVRRFVPTSSPRAPSLPLLPHPTPTGQAGPLHLGSASPSPHTPTPRGWASWGNQASWLFMKESRTPPGSPPECC